MEVSHERATCGSETAPRDAVSNPNYTQMGRPHYPLGRIEIPGGARTPPPFLFDDLREPRSIRARQDHHWSCCHSDRLRHRRPAGSTGCPSSSAPERRIRTGSGAASVPKAEAEAVEVAGQRKLLQWTIPGLAHFFTMWGFTILLLTIIEAYGDLFQKYFHIPGIGTWDWVGSSRTSSPWPCWWHSSCSPSSASRTPRPRGAQVPLLRLPHRRRLDRRSS